MKKIVLLGLLCSLCTVFAFVSAMDGIAGSCFAVEWNGTTALANSSAGGLNVGITSQDRTFILGASVPSYVPAASGNLNPFDVQGTVTRRNGPPTTGGTDPVNPDIKEPTPMGDAVLLLLCLAGVYGLYLYTRRIGRKHGYVNKHSLI